MVQGLSSPGRRRKYVPAVGPRLTRLLWFVMALFALLGVNGVYLVSVTILESATGETYQNYFYQLMFLGHLALGLLLIGPLLVFGALHVKNAHDRPNRRAVRAGYGLFGMALVLVASGVVLTRFESFEVRDPGVRTGAYWAHVISPLLVCWLFVLHRLAGKPIRWRVGLAWAGAAALLAAATLGLHSQDPRRWNVEGPASGEQYFFPSLARTADGNFIPANALMMDAYCAQCHADAHAQWANSVHRFASFNNPAYLASVRETRKVALERDGSVQASRFCAGCHDLVPFFSGAFDDPEFDDVGHPTSQAGVTCTGCHAITHVNSVRGNADYTIEEPAHYPFAFSENRFLRWVNRQLVKGKPAFHRSTFLKPLHKTPEFCGTCHKVHLPPELNGYKWLRGQNHYDSFLLSGVSGHGAQSFYYPPQAEASCNGCHMPLAPSEDFGARDFDGSGVRKGHDHMFPSANTAVPELVGLGDDVVARHAEFSADSVRVDLFGLREGGAIDNRLLAPLRPTLPALEPGREYLLETVVRTLTLGHHLTQGTVDSNELWLEVTVRDLGSLGAAGRAAGGRVIGKSGGTAADGEVDPRSHFVNAFVLDREGRRIDRRNAQDIFVALYNNQIPPGAADSVHYALTVPADAVGPIEIEAALRYRKFDTTYLRFFTDDAERVNDLPVLTLGADRVALPLASAPDRFPAGGEDALNQEREDVPEWMRWNDYGIGLLRKGGGKGQLRQAERAFRRVEELGRPDGPLNLARVYFAEGRLAEAVQALERAAASDPPAPPWTVAWFTGLVDKRNGFLDEAIASFRAILAMDSAETRARGFDFAKDYRVHVELGQALLERSKQERGEARAAERERLRAEARAAFEAALELDPENLSAHFNLALLFELAGDEERAAAARALHARYKPDDNARDAAIVAARKRYPAADHAAEAVVIYDLQRPGAHGLADPDTSPAEPK